MRNNSQHLDPSIYRCAIHHREYYHTFDSSPEISKVNWILNFLQASYHSDGFNRRNCLSIFILCVLWFLFFLIFFTRWNKKIAECSFAVFLIFDVLSSCARIHWNCWISVISNVSVNLLNIGYLFTLFCHVTL